MLLKTLGKLVISTANTPARVTSNQVDPAASIWCQAIFLTAFPGNTGSVWVGLSNLTIPGGVGLVTILPPPPASPNNPIIANVGGFGPFARSFDLSQLYVAVTNANDAVIVAYMVG